ncbi:MAG: nickel pincer cofactor biosynthesis protein LarB [Phycisphaerae bacterium]
MHPEALRKLLEQLAAGKLEVDAVVQRLQNLPFEDLQFARIDHHRTLRCGFAEVIFGQGKTDEQIEGIFLRLASTGANVLATRVGPGAARRVTARLPAADYHDLSRTLALRQRAPSESKGFIAIVAAGTSDLPVAEEARITAELMDQRTQTFYDVGVAGIHRLLMQSADLRRASVLVVVAGMEGALPSVVGGLVDAPVIAVPTSTGYGASFGGISALLAMLNTCSAGVSVVNIDNGFGAGYQAAMINRLADSRVKSASGRPSEASSEGSDG